MFAEFRISSTPISTPIALRRVSTVKIPQRKTARPTTRKWLRPISMYVCDTAAPSVAQLLSRQDDRADQRRQEHDRRDLERQQVLAQEARADVVGRAGTRRALGERAELPRGAQQRVA